MCCFVSHFPSVSYLSPKPDGSMPNHHDDTCNPTLQISAPSLYLRVHPSVTSQTRRLSYTPASGDFILCKEKSITGLWTLNKSDILTMSFPGHNTGSLPPEQSIRMHTHILWELALDSSV